MIDYSVTIEGADTVIADLEEIPARAKSAAARALNRAINSAKVLMAQRMAADVGIGVTAVKKSLPVRQATVDRLTARLSTTLKRIPLIEFKASGPEPSRGRGRGVSYRLPGGRSRVPNAFIATMGSGHRGVFIRAGVGARKSPSAWSKNLPIVELKGPSLGHVFTKYRTEVLARAQESFVTNFDHEMGFLKGGDVGAE